MARNYQTLSLETLEGRNLMTANITAALSSGVLTINGSSGNDHIYVHQINNQLTVEGVKGSFSAAAVKAMRINAGAGNDEVVLFNSQLARGNQDIQIATYIDAGLGNDLVTGGASFDYIVGGGGNDRLYGTWGDDILVGGTGDDYLNGGAGNDVIYGQAGYDTLDGDLGNDRLDGGDDADLLLGGAGNDILVGGYGYDLLYGGAGTNYLVDTYSYNAPNKAGIDFSLYTQSATPYQTSLSYQPTTALQSILGPDLYNGIFVNKTIPNGFLKA